MEDGEEERTERTGGEEVGERRKEEKRGERGAREAKRPEDERTMWEKRKLIRSGGTLRRISESRGNAASARSRRAPTRTSTFWRLNCNFSRSFSLVYVRTSCSACMHDGSVFLHRITYTVRGATQYICSYFLPRRATRISEAANAFSHCFTASWGLARGALMTRAMPVRRSDSHCSSN